MTKDKWDELYRNSREEAWMLPDRKWGIAMDLIRSLGEVVWAQGQKIAELEQRNDDADSYAREQNERNS